jgi:hypothetical protein
MPQHGRRRRGRVRWERPRAWVVAARVFIVAHLAAIVAYGTLGLLWVVAVLLSTVARAERPDWPFLDLSNWRVAGLWVLSTVALMLVLAGFRRHLKLDRPKLVILPEDDGEETGDLS